jgi:hypothetical protein
MNNTLQTGFSSNCDENISEEDNNGMQTFIVYSQRFSF